MLYDSEKSYQNTEKVKWKAVEKFSQRKYDLKATQRKRVSFQSVPYFDPQSSKLCSNFGNTVLEDMAEA